VAATHALRCHPETPARAARGIGVRVERRAAAVSFRFSLDGALDRLRIPAPRAPAVGHELWRHTCFEAFVAVDGAGAYRELNVSPSGEWAVGAFSGYRERAPHPSTMAAPRIAVARTGGCLTLTADVALEDLGLPPSAPLRLGLAAVVEEADGGLSYWSLHHPPGRPDFHHRDAFVLRLEPPGGAC
jgi:hypothetical protein